MPQMTEQTKEIGGVNYTVYYLDPITALDLGVDLGKVLGPAFAGLFGEGGDLGSVGDRQVDFGAGVRLLFEHLDKSMLRDAVKKMAGVTHADGVSLSSTYLAHFHGKIGQMMQWLAFALQVQYSDLFDGWGNGAGLTGILASLQSKSPPTSTGSSGDPSPVA